LSLLDAEDRLAVDTHRINLPGRFVFVSDGLLQELERQFKLDVETRYAD